MTDFTWPDGIPPWYRRVETVYTNSLASEAHVRDFRLEGDAAITFSDGRMRMENQRDPTEGQASNFVLWCPQNWPDQIAIRWDFWPLREPGLCILFFAAQGRGGEDLFDPTLAPRAGLYNQYHSGDLNALHVAYFRRRWPDERAFHTCNLRKSHGFHLVAQGGDPIPSVEDAHSPYHLSLVKFGATVTFAINELPIFHWQDDGQRYGPVLAGGKLGLRQMAPLMAEYANLRIERLER